MDTDAVSSLVKDICGTPSGSHLLLALLPAGGPPSSLQLFARALNPSRTVFHVLHEGAHGGGRRPFGNNAMRGDVHVQASRSSAISCRMSSGSGACHCTVSPESGCCSASFSACRA